MIRVYLSVRHLLTSDPDGMLMLDLEGDDVCISFGTRDNRLQIAEIQPERKSADVFAGVPCEVSFELDPK